MSKYKNDNRVLLFTEGLSDTAVIDLSGSKLVPRLSGPIRALKVIGDAYTLDIFRRCDFTVGPADRMSPRYESWASCDAECGVSYVNRPSHHARGADVIGRGCGPACASPRTWRYRFLNRSTTSRFGSQISFVVISTCATRYKEASASTSASAALFAASSASSWATRTLSLSS